MSALKLLGPAPGLVVGWLMVPILNVALGDEANIQFGRNPGNGDCHSGYRAARFLLSPFEHNVPGKPQPVYKA
jgi:hypothetical protein